MLGYRCTNNKRILVLANLDVGLYRFRKELLETLLAMGHEVYVSLPGGVLIENLENMGCRFVETEVDRRGLNPVRDMKLFLEYRKLLKEIKPDLVVTYTIKPNIYGGLASRLAGVTYAANVTGLGTAFQRKGLAQIVTVLYKAALSKAKTVFFENEENAREFRKRKILKAERQTVLPGAGINLEEYPCTAYPDHDEIRFLYLGRIMKEKGMDELFAAMNQLRQRYGSRVMLDMVGFFEDEYKDQVEQLVKDGIAVFHGFQQDPRPYYTRADCVVLPSYHEGMSNVLLEAAAMGRPIITSDIPGCREAVENGSTGCLCRVKDEEALYEAMCRMAETPRNVREKMGQAGRRKMELEFDKKKVVEQTVAALFSE